jgi:DHA1 family bicyclomycin/chloramphenicol resistance-like MFS transporter
MEKLITTALISFFVVSATYVAFYIPKSDVRVLLLFCLAIFQYRFPFRNIRAMAMQPVGHIAGTAAAVTCISTIMAVPISIYIGLYCRTGSATFVGFQYAP